MTDSDREQGRVSRERCPDCGRFCGVVYRWRGASYTEVKSCVGCGRNPPTCAEETGTVKGCTRNATHKGAHRENRRERYWCADHAPESADTLPYVEGEKPRVATDGGEEQGTVEQDRAEILERFEAPEPEHVATFETDELTALCPFKFGGPDFYDLTLRYRPDQYEIEARSLKRYVESWREDEVTAETLATNIYEDVVYIAAPAQLYVRLEQARRGGIEETVEVGDERL